MDALEDLPEGVAEGSDGKGRVLPLQCKLSDTVYLSYKVTREAESGSSA